jgi:hypothetical protein
VTRPAAIWRAKQMLARAHWAAGAYAGYDRASVLRIAEAVAGAAHAQAAKYAEWAVKETGFGVAEHKVLKNQACSLGVLERYRDEDFVSPRLDPAAKIMSLPRPAGVVLALTPSTNPVCSVFFKVILCLLTRNAIVVSPHPMAKECCGDAVRMLAAAATEAGAPDGVISLVEDVTVPLIEALMADPVTSVIVATGGTAVVRAAHRSGNPALGVGPGNVPVLVDATADAAAAARLITESKAFDNSVLCTNESVLIAEDAVAGPLLTQLKRCGGVLLDEAGRDRLRDFLFPDGRLNGEAIGKDASWIAARAPGAAAGQGAARAVPAGAARGAVRPREALPGARRGHHGHRGPRHRGGPRGDQDRRGGPLRGHPQPGPADRAAVRRAGAGAAGRGQRGQQHRQRGAGHQPGPVDDAGHRVRRAQLDRREPGAEAPGQLGPGGLPLGGGRAVR